MSLLGVIILSPDGLMIRLAGLDDFTLIFYRGLLPAITITLLLLFYYRNAFLGILLATGWAGLLNGLLYATTSVSFVYSIQQTSVANTLVIVSSAPIFAAVLSLVFLHENQRPLTWAAIFVAFASIVVIGWGSYGNSGLSGDLFALLCAFSTGCSAVLVRYKKHTDLVPSVIFGSVLVAIYAWVSAPVTTLSDLQFIYIGVIGIVLLPFGFMILTIAPRFAPSAEVQLVYLLESILGPLWVWMVIRETPSTTTLVGGAMLLASVAWFAHSAASEERGTVTTTSPGTDT